MNIDATIKLANLRALRSELRFKLDQASLRVAHYTESISACDKEIDHLEDQIAFTENKPGHWIEAKLDEWLGRLRR